MHSTLTLSLTLSHSLSLCLSLSLSFSLSLSLPPSFPLSLTPLHTKKNSADFRCMDAPDLWMHHICRSVQHAAIVQVTLWLNAACCWDTRDNTKPPNEPFPWAN